MAITHDTTIYACDARDCHKQFTMDSAYHHVPDNWVYITLQSDVNGDGEAVLCAEHALWLSTNLDPEVWN